MTPPEIVRLRFADVDQKIIARRGRDRINVYEARWKSYCQVPFDASCEIEFVRDS